MINFGRYQVFAATPQKYSARVVKIVERSLVIDMLAPLKLDFTPEAFAPAGEREEVAMFRSSGITGFHNSIGLGGPDCVRGRIGVSGRVAGLCRPQLAAVLAGRAAQRISTTRRRTRKIAVIMGLQNAEHFREPKDVKTFYQLGQRCSQLTYNSQNLIGSGSTDRVDGGVSDFGVEIIKAMNEVGHARRRLALRRRRPRSTRSSCRPSRSPSPIPTAAR